MDKLNNTLGNDKTQKEPKKGVIEPIGPLVEQFSLEDEQSEELIESIEPNEPIELIEPAEPLIEQFSSENQSSSITMTKSDPSLNLSNKENKEVAKERENEVSESYKKLIDQLNGKKMTDQHYQGLLTIVKYVDKLKPEQVVEKELRITGKVISALDLKSKIKIKEKIVNHIKEVIKEKIVYVNKGGVVMNQVDAETQTEDDFEKLFQELPKVQENLDKGLRSNLFYTQALNRNYPSSNATPLYRDPKKWRMYPMTKDEIHLLKNMRDYETLFPIIYATGNGKLRPGFDTYTDAIGVKKLYGKSHKRKSINYLLSASSQKFNLIQPRKKI